MEIRTRVRLGLFALCCAISAVAAAQVVTPAGGSIQLNGGTLDLGGTSLQDAGALSLGAGMLANATDIVIAAGGSIDAGSGTITLDGNWSDLGSFTPGTSSVNFVDGPASSTISGATTFNAASFVSSTGKSYVFPVGLTQTFNTSLTILGTVSAAIQFRSATAGHVANVNLAASGAQNIQFVGVSNVHATGQHLAPSQTNDGGTGDALGWFRNYFGAAVPAPLLSTLGMLLLVLVLVPAALRRHRISISSKGK